MTQQILTSLLAFLCFATYAQSPKNINVSQENAVIQGYDAVAYFENSSAIKGNKDIQVKYNDAIYYFSSENNKAKFLKNPSQYEPQFGGFCAYGMSEGYKAPIDPKAFSIVDGKLFLNYNLDVKKDWTKKQAERIAKANKNWQKIISKK